MTSTDSELPSDAPDNALATDDRIAPQLDDATNILLARNRGRALPSAMEQQQSARGRAMHSVVQLQSTRGRAMPLPIEMQSARGRAMPSPMELQSARGRAMPSAMELLHQSNFDAIFYRDGESPSPRYPLVDHTQ